MEELGDGGSSDALRIILDENIGKICVLFTKNDFRYESKIIKTFGDWVQVLDLKKGYTKILRISDLKEVEIKWR